MSRFRIHWPLDPGAEAADNDGSHRFTEDSMTPIVTDTRCRVLLARLLRGRSSRAAALDTATALLDRFGGLRAACDADGRTLTRVNGIRRAQREALSALPDLARRYYEESLTMGDIIRSPGDTERFLIARLSDLEHELFACLFLDNRHQVLSFEPLFRGTIDGTSVYPREVVKEALKINAAAVILAHNHPSGVAEPSDADERITRRLKAALELVDIRLLDHLIVGHGRVTSLASRGSL